MIVLFGTANDPILQAIERGADPARRIPPPR